MTAKFLTRDSTVPQQIAAGLKGGAHWWWQQISSLWPVSTLLAEDRPQTITLRLLPDTAANAATGPWLPLDLSATRPETIEIVKRALEGTAATVTLDPSQLYVCKSTFPKAALKAGSEAIEYHLQTASPLPPEQIYYDNRYQIEGNQAHAEIALVRRSAIDGIIQFFEANALALERIEGSKENSTVFCFYQRVSFGQGLFSARTALALCASLFLLPVLVAAIMWAYGAYLSQVLEAKLDAERATYAEEIALSRNLDRYEAIQAELQAASTPSQLVAVITKISEAVPRSAWLDRLSFDGSAVRLQGYSADANGVAGSLRGLPALQNIRLDRVTASGGDQRAPLFTISATWSQTKRPANAE